MAALIEREEWCWPDPERLGATPHFFPSIEAIDNNKKTGENSNDEQVYVSKSRDQSLMKAETLMDM